MTEHAFPPIFVINLERSPARREAMAAQLDPLGMPYSFFKAVDGATLPDDVNAIPAYDGPGRRLRFGKDMTKGEIGCLLSHRGVYEQMVAQNIPVAIIMEDDVFIEPTFPTVIRQILQAPLRWDVIRFLAYAKVQKRGRDVYALPLAPYKLARLPTTSGGAYCYMITQKAAQEFLRHMQKNAAPVDMLHGYVWKTGLETFLLRPSPVAADLENESTIGDKRFDKKIALAGWERAAYPLTRGAHKVSELIGKRLSYALAWPRDTFGKDRG